MNVPVHNYMTYKKESSLGYFAQIRPNNYSFKDKNQVYNTMKSFYIISKIFGSLKKDKNTKPKTKIRFNSLPKKLSTLQNFPVSQLQNKTHFKSTTSIFNTSAQQSITLSRRKSISLNFQRTRTQIEDIKSRADQIHTKLNNNRHQIKLVTSYNKILDNYFEKIPSPTASVTREAIQEEERFNKICKEDIYLEMNKNKKRYKRKKIDEFHQPQIPEHIISKLVRQNKQELQKEKNRKELKKNNKIRIKQKFLSYFPYGKEAKKIAERSKSQGFINIANF